MSENTKTPRIRFKGFTDAWEQRKVNEVVASVDTGRSHFQAKMSGKYEILGSTAVIGYDDEFDYQGEFLLTARVGANAGTLYRHSGKVKISDNTVFLQGNNLDFMYYALFNYDLKKLSFGTGQPLVKASELKKLSLILPSSEKEKKYVGRFFEQIDNLITLHQRKQIKQNLGVLPEKCCTKITNSWEQRKLGEIANIQKGQQLGKAEMSSTGTYYVLNGGMEASGFTNQYNTLANTISISEGGNSCGYVSLNLEHFWSGGHNYTLQNLKINTIFLYQWLKRQEKRIMALRVGSGLPNIQKSSLQDVYVKYSTTTEQQAIALFLIKIDNLITLHQCKYFNPFSNFSSHLVCFEKYKKANSWEQCELGKIANEVTRTDPESTAPIMMITANNGFIEQSDRYAFDNAGESLKKYILLEKGELAYNHGASKLRPYGSCFALTTVEKARIPFVYHCFSAKNYNSEFLSIELNGENVEKQLRRIVSSGARMDGLLNISFTEYSTITLSLPKRKEQDKISNFFSILDNLITLHQRKLKDFHGGFL